MAKHYASYSTVEGDELVTMVMSDKLMTIPSSGVKLIAENADKIPSYGELSKKVDFTHFRKYKITGAGPIYVLTERTDTEIRATQEYIDAKQLAIDSSRGTHLTYKGTSSDLSYIDTGSLSFPGSDIVGTILAVEILFKQTGSASTSSVRLYDVTNSLVICELTGLTAEGKIVKDLGTISNVPTDKAVLELQAKVGDVADTAKTFELHIVH